MNTAEMCDLQQHEVALLNQFSGGVLSVQEFVQDRWRDLPYYQANTSKIWVRGNALGLTGKYDITPPEISPYSIACRALELIHYDNFRDEYDLTLDSSNAGGYTARAMATLTSLPMPTVFFVPPYLRSHEFANWTAAEMEWMLGNLDRIGNVQFAFGLYDYVVNTGIQEVGDPEYCAQLFLSALLG